MDVGDELSGVCDHGGGTAEADGEGEVVGGEFLLDDVKGVVVCSGESVDCLVAVADCD